ncbi:MAG: FAD:protein FMN transferase [Planctomycetaceae bacterium]
MSDTKGTAPADAAVGEVQVLEGMTWTEYNIRAVVRPGDEPLANLQPHLLSIFESLDHLYSNFIPTSEVSRFNASSSTEWIEVSRETAHLVSEALRYAADSDGAFDPTLAPLIRAWHFEQEADASDGRRTLPSEAALEELRKNVGYQHLEARLDPPGLKKGGAGLEINLSAIAKGTIVDRIALFLADRGYRDFMVQYGGEVVAKGQKPDGSPWSIAISRPQPDGVGVEAVVPLRDEAMATSGNYRNFFEVDGVRYSHTIDPKTGRPVTHGLASVTVFAPTCEQADACATILSVLGPERGLKWATDRNLAAWMLVPDAESADGSGFQAISTPAFESQFAQTLERISPPAESAGDRSIWPTVLLGGGVFAIALLGLALGTILSGRRLKGSCGGLAGMKDAQGHSICSSCTTPPEECADFRRQLARPPVTADAPETPTHPEE